jgi:hypothetical protein
VRSLALAVGLLASLLAVSKAEVESPGVGPEPSPAAASALQLPAKPRPIIASVSSASPTRLAIQPHGPPGTVRLAGTALAAVAGGYLERYGQRVNGFGVRLVRSSADSVELTIGASRLVGPPWDAPARLVLENVDGRKLATPVWVTVPAPQVDLVVTSCGFDTAGVTVSATLPPIAIAKQIPISATIQNRGTQPHSWSAGTVIARFSALSQRVEVTAPAGGLALGPGATTQVTAAWSWPRLAVTQLGTWWVVDPGDQVFESDESNALSCPFTWNPRPAAVKPALADLEVPAISTRPYRGKPGTSFVFTVRVRNKGPGDATHPATLATCSLNGGHFLGKLQPHPTSPLKAGQHRDYVWSYVAIALGPMRLQCRADDRDDMAEADENNNVGTVSFVVDPP